MYYRNPIGTRPFSLVHLLPFLSPIFSFRTLFHRLCVCVCFIPYNRHEFLNCSRVTLLSLLMDDVYGEKKNELLLVDKAYRQWFFLFYKCIQIVKNENYLNDFSIDSKCDPILIMNIISNINITLGIVEI